jgi:hypothetical protein
LNLDKTAPLKIDIDIDTLTLGDWADIEDAGGDFKKLESARTLVALLWVTMRKADPKFTLEAARAMPLAGLSGLEVNVKGGAADPKEPAA